MSLIDGGATASRPRPCAAAALAVVLALGALTAAAQDPAGRVYVRYIEFEGVEGIADRVLRRELLQLEAALIDVRALERSRQRLERLPFIAEAQVRLRPIAGVHELTDVIFTIEQAPARHYGAGGAWSASMGPSAHGYYVDENLFGVGQRLSLDVDVSDIRRIANVTHTEPYATPWGVSRRIGVAVRELDRLTADASDLKTEFLTARLEYAWRIAEAQTLGVGARVGTTALTAGEASSRQLADWVASNARTRTVEAGPATRLRELDLQLRWAHDTRDRAPFPRRGIEQSLQARAALPGLRVQHYTLDYRISAYRPAARGWTAALSARLAYGASYRGRTSSLPPYLNWFAGGPDTVRGFREGRLGPRDTLGNPYGGNLLVTGRLELERPWPWPQQWRERARIGVFYDVGNVFSTEAVAFTDDADQPLDYGFELGRLRHAVGAAARWQVPFGSIRLSYAIPLNARRDGGRFRTDETRRLQLSLGVDF